MLATLTIAASIKVAAIVAYTATALVTDVRYGKIPNVLTVPMFLAGVVYQVSVSGWSGLGFAAAGFGTGFGLLLILFLTGGGGGGDVKFMGALGAWFGWWATLEVFVVSAILAAIYTVIYLFWRLVSGQPIRRAPIRADSPAEAERLARASRRLGGYVRYAIFGALASWLVLARLALVGKL